MLYAICSAILVPVIVKEHQRQNAVGFGQKILTLWNPR